MFHGVKRIRQGIALLLISVLLLTGCSGKSGEEQGQQQGQQEGGGQEAGTNHAAEETDGGEKSMGRYLEQEITVPEETRTMGSFPMGYLQKLDNGKLALLEQVAGLYVSADQGESWKYKSTPWLSEMIGKYYIAEVALAPDGGAAVIYDELADTDSGESEETPETEPTDGQEAESAKPTDGQEAEGTKTAENQEGTEKSNAENTEDTENSSEAEDTSETEDTSGGDGYDPEYFYVDPDGNKKEIIFKEPDNRLNGIWYDKDSQLYASDMEHKVYQVNMDDGTLKELFEVQGLVDYLCVTKNYMVAFHSRGVDIYDRKEEMLTDAGAVLQEYILENIGDKIGSTDRGHAVVAVEGEQDDVIYFAYEGGLCRYVMGGTAIEQVIDGNASCFGDLTMYLSGIAILSDNEFVVLYEGIRLYRYTYDPNVPTIPEEQITVYSLEENASMRQAVSLYQRENQNIYIRYEIGMTGEDGMTKEDAIKNLNTKMMSGSGPDVLILDGLPAESYKEKGILADVGSIVDAMDGEDSLFPNIIDTCREDGKIYAVPMRVQVPMVVGAAEDVDAIKDLNTLADTVEKLRQENPEGAIIGLGRETEVLHTLGGVSSAAWTKEDGSLNKEALTEFLTDAARIYQAEIAGYDAKELEDYKNRMGNFDASFARDGEYYSTASTKAIDIVMGEQKLAVGKMYRVDFDFNVIFTLGEQEGLSYGLWQGQVPGGFIPDGLVGICSGSAESSTVLEFYRFLFGRKAQDADLMGFPVNMASFDTFSETSHGEFDGGGIAISNEEGDIFSLDIKWADADSFQRLKEMVQNVGQFSTGDASVEEIVYEVGPKVLDGSMDVARAVDEIAKKTAIYLAE